MAEPKKEIQLSDEQIDMIAEKAAERAVQKMTDDAYKAIGKTVIEKLLAGIGICFLAFYFWLEHKK
jgi:predicted metalloenzyme YecM